MNKLTGALFGIILMIFMVTSAFACSKDTGTITGASCSIADLTNLYKTDTVKEKAITTYREDRGLHPFTLKKSNKFELYSLDCELGICIPRLNLSPTE